MNLSRVLALRSGRKLAAIRHGQVDDRKYITGTIGRVRITEGDSPRIELLDGSDLGYVDMRNWEPLIKCSYCPEEIAVTTVLQCQKCQRPGHCPACMTAHLPCDDEPPVVQSRSRHRRPSIKTANENQERSTICLA